MRSKTLDLSGSQQDALIWFEQDRGIISGLSGRIASGGINISESIVPDGNYAPGNCPSAYCTVSLMNDDGLLADFPYGWGEVNIGKLDASETETVARPQIGIGSILYRASDSIFVPFLYGENNDIYGIYVAGPDNQIACTNLGTYTDTLVSPTTGMNPVGVYVVKSDARYDARRNGNGFMRIYVLGSDGKMYRNDDIYNFSMDMDPDDFTFSEVSCPEYMRKLVGSTDYIGQSYIVGEPYDETLATYNRMFYVSKLSSTSETIEVSVEAYEYVPVGTFNFSTKSKRKSRTVTITGYDRIGTLDMFTAKDIHDYLQFLSGESITNVSPYHVVKHLDKFLLFAISTSGNIGPRDDPWRTTNIIRGEGFPSDYSLVAPPTIGTLSSVPTDDTSARNYVMQACRVLGGNVYCNGTGEINYYTAKLGIDASDISASSVLDTEYIIYDDIADKNTPIPSNYVFIRTDGTKETAYRGTDSVDGDILVSGNCFLTQDVTLSLFSTYWISKTAKYPNAQWKNGYRPVIFELFLVEDIRHELGDWMKFRYSDTEDYITFPIMQREITWDGVYRETISATGETRWTEIEESSYDYSQQIYELSSSKSDVDHTHDDRYYTETETDTLLSGKANTKTVTISASGTGTFTVSGGTRALLTTNGNHTNLRGAYVVYKSGSGTAIVKEVLAASGLTFSASGGTVTVTNAQNATAYLDFVVFAGGVS